MISFAEFLSRFEFRDSPDTNTRTALQVRIGPKNRHRTWTFAELAAAATARADAYRAIGGGAGQRIALLMPHSERLVVSFFGALYAGMIPSVVAWPTSKMDPAKYRRNLLSVVGSLRADWLVTESSMADQLGSVLGDTRVIDPEIVPRSTASSAPMLNRTGPAFIQFSGGTTGNQKSVPIAFEQLYQQIVSYDAVLRFSAQDTIISWLPLYHDMGLVACLLIPFALRLPLVMFAPMEWVMDPRPFLRSVGESKATLCWLPNFAFSFLAARAGAPDPNVDLASLRAVINCSEPVRAESMAAFADRFQQQGLKGESLHTCYAMAEATFAVTQTSPSDPPRHLRIAQAGFERGQILPTPTGERAITSCGVPIPELQLRVVDDDNDACHEGQIGEIEIRGPAVMTGYLDAQRGSTGAILEGGWYRTGDLGALIDKHVYVTGRKKDLIMVGGVNVYPEDIEVSLAQIDGLRPGRAVAMGVFDGGLGTERLVVVAEATDGLPSEQARDLELAVRKAVLVVCGISPTKVFIVPPNWIVKSTAGKLARGETKERVIAAWHDLAGEPPDSPK